MGRDPRVDGPSDFGAVLRRLVAEGTVPSTLRRFEPGATVYGGKADDDSPYLIVSGRVKTVLDTRSGKTCLLRIHGPGEVIGELALLGDCRHESAVAMGQVEAYRMSAAGLARAMGAAHLHHHVLRHLAHRLAEQQKAISILLTDDSEQRLATVLLDLAERFGRPEGDSVWLAQRITQGELAEIVGTTRSRIGVFLRKFKERGWIEFSRGLVLRVSPDSFEDYLEAREAVA